MHTSSRPDDAVAHDAIDQWITSQEIPKLTKTGKRKAAFVEKSNTQS
jgi:hypothetical protein